MTAGRKERSGASKMARQLDHVIAAGDESGDAIDKLDESDNRNAVLAHDGDAGNTQRVDRYLLAPSSSIGLKPRLASTMTPHCRSNSLRTSSWMRSRARTIGQNTHMAESQMLAKSIQN
jgi:hypothetical protein